MATENTQPPKQPRQVPPKQGPTVGDLIEIMDGDLLALRRGYAGYSSLSGALNTLMGTLPPGQRAKGLPVLTHKATVTGRDTVEVVTDLKKVHPDHITYVIGPMIYVHGGDMLQAIDSLLQSAQLVKAMIAAAMPVAPPNNTGHAYQETEQSPDEEEEVVHPNE